MQIVAAILIASSAIVAALNSVCCISARAAASAYGPPEPIARRPSSSGWIRSPVPEIR